MAAIKRIQEVIRELYRGPRSKDTIEKHYGQTITDTLNEVYAEESSELDPILAKMQFASVEREEW